MRVLGIDASTKSSGFAVIEDKQLIYYNCKTSNSANLFDRISIMTQELFRILTEYKPQKVFMEEVLLKETYPNTLKPLIYLQAFNVSTLNSFNIKPCFVTPNQWRQHCGIPIGRGFKREEAKIRDKQFVENEFGIKVNDDIADAIGIAFYGAQLAPKAIQSKAHINLGGFQLE